MLLAYPPNAICLSDKLTLGLSRPIKNIDLVVHGHTNSEQVICKKNQIWIDTLRETTKLTILTAEQLFSFLEDEHA